MDKEFIDLVYDAVVLMACCDRILHVEEIKVLNDYIATHQIGSHKKIPTKDEVESVTTDHIKEIINKIASLCDTDEKKLFLLDRLSQIADADLALHENEIKILDYLHLIWGFNVSLTKQILEWTPEQQKLIELEPETKVIVSAPPGSGKTAVIVARIEHLIEEHDIEPTNIWLLSFTRTAVREMKDRIHVLESFMPSIDLRIATLDSKAFTMNYSLSKDMTYLQNGYEENIKLFLNRLKNDDLDLKDFLNNLEHIIIDEAQDFIGPRCEICLQLMKSVSKECGFTILGDEYQQIYGKWAVGEGEESISLMEKIQHDHNKEFNSVELSKIHRTNALDLLNLMDDLRVDIAAFDGTTNHDDLERRRNIIFDNTEQLEKLDNNIELSERHLILFRLTKDVVTACKNLFFEGRLFKLRLPGYSRYLSPWVCRLFEFAKKKDKKLISEEDVSLFLDNLILRDKKYLNLEKLWFNLRHYCAEEGKVSINKLREILGKTSKPPVEFQNPEFGFSGPVLGTVHTSKGRESDNVIFTVPKIKKRSKKDLSEESRVLLVGASRARKKLQVIDQEHQENSDMRWYWNRHYNELRRDKQFSKFICEIGIEGDYDPYSIVTNENSLIKVKRTQQFLENLNPLSGMINCTAERQNPTGVEYLIYSEWHGEKYYLGKFSSKFHKYLTYLSKKLLGNRVAPPVCFSGFRIVDIASFVCTRDDDKSKKILTPYLETGAWLYPVFYGFGPLISFRTDYVN